MLFVTWNWADWSHTTLVAPFTCVCKSTSVKTFQERNLQVFEFSESRVRP